MNNEEIEQIVIIDGKTTIFKDKYYIPIYQRAYAWEEKEIRQLIEDINKFESEPYYIGTLIVNKEKDSCNYEVIDGQQRLTTIYLLLNYLEIEVENQLSFKSREKSNYILDKNIISKVISYRKGECDLSDEELKKMSKEILNGLKIIHNIFIEDKIDVAEFEKKLSKVKIFRIPVPKDTDLNRYFEIMNTRGEQLLQTDIIKAKLMSYLKSEAERDIYAEIWDACADMSGYVQKHLSRKLREIIFGDEMTKYLDNEFNLIIYEYNDRVKNNNINSEEKNVTFDEIKNFNENNIKELTFENKDNNDDDDDKQKVEYTSIIDFNYYLLYFMKYYYECEMQQFGSIIIDDKKIIDEFMKITDIIKDDKKMFAVKFVLDLLKSRFLFDKFIIKRLHKSIDDKQGKWSLDKQECYQNKKNSLYLSTVNTFGKEKDNINIIMMQSALRVSYPSPDNMNWLYDTMNELMNDKTTQILSNDNIEDSWIENYENSLYEKLISPVKKHLLNPNNYDDGVNLPRVVFNCLDYLLWKEDQKKYNDFEFQYRDSVEHWYPRNPSGEGSFEQWDKNDENGSVDRFGNLCLVTSSLNSKFSNSSPNGKKDLVKNMNLSIKLRKMIDIFDKGCSPEEWKKEKCKKHEDDMIQVLKKGCE